MRTPHATPGAHQCIRPVLEQHAHLSIVLCRSQTAPPLQATCTARTPYVSGLFFDHSDLYLPLTGSLTMDSSTTAALINAMNCKAELAAQVKYEEPKMLSQPSCRDCSLQEPASHKTLQSLFSASRTTLPSVFTKCSTPLFFKEKHYSTLPQDAGSSEGGGATPLFFKEKHYSP